MMQLIIGVVGTILLLAAWLIETFESIRKHKVSIHPHFAILYIIGISVLTYYSYLIADPIFFWLNLILLIAISSEFLYSLSKSKFKHGKK